MSMNLEEKFNALRAENAPGQEVRKGTADLEPFMRGQKLEGVPVDFSHGDVDAFTPTPGALEAWQNGFQRGGQQAYTEYRGAASIRDGLAARLGEFTGRAIDAADELILTPGTQGALFLALGATVASGTKAAVMEPDYFANRKLVRFFERRWPRYAAAGRCVPMLIERMERCRRSCLCEPPGTARPRWKRGSTNRTAGCSSGLPNTNAFAMTF